jgi:hypothetical protein
MTATHEILAAYATGRPMTQAQVEDASGIHTHAVGMYIKRLRDYGDIQRVVCGCACVKHQITQQGVVRLSAARTNGGHNGPLPEEVLAAGRLQPNSVFALGAGR